MVHYNVHEQGEKQQLKYLFLVNLALSSLQMSTQIQFSSNIENVIDVFRDMIFSECSSNAQK